VLQIIGATNDAQEQELRPSQQEEIP
jgi:hypothetical protein